MKRSELKHSDVADAILSRLGHLSQLEDGQKAQILATYCLDLIDNILLDELGEKSSPRERDADSTYRDAVARLDDARDWMPSMLFSKKRDL